MVKLKRIEGLSMDVIIRIYRNAFLVRNRGILAGMKTPHTLRRALNPRPTAVQPLLPFYLPMKLANETSELSSDISIYSSQ